MDRRELLAAERGTLFKEAETRIALVYPSPYRVAMSRALRRAPGRNARSPASPVSVFARCAATI